MRLEVLFTQRQNSLPPTPHKFCAFKCNDKMGTGWTFTGKKGGGVEGGWGGDGDGSHASPNPNQAGPRLKDVSLRALPSRPAGGAASAPLSGGGPAPFSLQPRARCHLGGHTPS